MPHLQQVIISQESRGSGKTTDPYRSITCVYATDGELIADNDRTDYERHPARVIGTALQAVTAAKDLACQEQLFDVACRLRAMERELSGDPMPPVGQEAPAEPASAAGA